MPSSKPKLQGYIEQSLFNRFEAERQSWNLTQSQALERILSERYEGDQAQTPSYGGDDLTWLKTEFKGYQALCTSYFEQIFHRLDILESPDGLPGDTPGLTSDSPDGLPGDTPGLTSDSPDGLPGDTPGLTSDSPDGLPGDIPKIIKSSADELLVICRFEIENPKNPVYWRSQRDGFITDLHKAKLYQLRGMVRRQIENLKNDPNYALHSNQRLSYKTFEELKQMQAEAIAK